MKSPGWTPSSIIYQVYDTKQLTSLDLGFLINKMRIIITVLQDYCDDKIRESLHNPGIKPHIEQMLHKQ